MEEMNLENVAEQYKQQQMLMSGLMDNLESFIEKYEQTSKSLSEVKCPNGVDLAERIDEIEISLADTKNAVQNYERTLQNNLLQTRFISAGFDSIKNNLQKVENQISDIRSKSERFLTSYQEVLKTMAQFDKVMREIENIDFKDYEERIESYTNNLKILNDKIENGLSNKIEKNLKAQEDLEEKLNLLSQQSEKQGQSFVDIARNVEALTTLLSGLTKKGVVDEQYVYAIIDKWADESRVKYKPR